MSRKSSKWFIPRTHTFPDPRLAIAQHIGWERPLYGETEFHIPEPDNFNYAVKTDRPMECPYVANHVYYKEKDSWWTAYLVTPEVKDDFLAWAEPIDFDLCWYNNRSPKLRRKRPFLWSRASSAEMSVNERLYTMGHYDTIKQKVVNGDAEEIINSRVGSIRPELPNWPPKWANELEEEDED